MIHVPDDVDKYQVGVENLSAFIYENFQGYFRHFIASGHKGAEQLRNRLIERRLYLLPTSSVGLIINTAESFEIEAKKSAVSRSNSNVFVKFIPNREISSPKKLVFSTFVLGYQYPNNVCMLLGSVIIVNDKVEFLNGSGKYTLIGVKFRKLENAFVKPYVSSHFKTYLASDVSSFDEWIKGKMEAITFKFLR